MKIFLDVGGHEGQTLLSVLDPKYAFDRICVFEPVKKLHVKLYKIASGKPNVTLFKFGLWIENTSKMIYSPGSLAGSIFEYHDHVNEHDFECCDFVNASEWFTNNITVNDEVFVKLNCEGAEADILLNLLQSGEIFKIKDVMIDFDVRKIKGLENMPEQVLKSFAQAGFTSFSLCEDVYIGPSSITRVQNWLDMRGANNQDIVSSAKQMIYWLKMVILSKRPGAYWEFKHAIKKHVPKPLLKLIGARRK